MAVKSAQFGLRERPPTPAVRPFDLPPRLKPMLDRAKAGLAEPFRGVASGNGIVPGLFTIENTDISLAPLLEAARLFVAALSTEQRKIASFAIGDEAWRKWSNIHPWLMRHGVCLADLRHDQREAALALLRESMSAAGYKSARDVMRLNEHALEITGKPEEYGEWLYWVSIFGTPSPSEPWGWQIDGHHLNVNGFVLGDQLVLTPNFMGSEPVLARFGKYRGTRVFAAEEEEGYALMRAFSPEERRRATIGKDLPSELLTAAFNDNRRIDLAGIRYDELSPQGRERLAALLATYTGRIRPGPRRNPLGRGEALSKRHAFRLDRPVRRRQPVLLSHPEPGDPCRVRPPVRHHVRQRHSLARPYPYRRAHPQWQRLRQGFAAPALRPPRPLASDGSPPRNGRRRLG